MQCLLWLLRSFFFPFHFLSGGGLLLLLLLLFSLSICLFFLLSLLPHRGPFLQLRCPTRFLSGSGASSIAEKYLGELSVRMIISATAESANGNGAAAVVAGVLVVLVSVGEERCPSLFSFCLGAVDI